MFTAELRINNGSEGEGYCKTKIKRGLKWKGLLQNEHKATIQ